MFSVVIPTLQKNNKVLMMLLNQLILDPCVAEIIVIDNSLKGLDIDNNKIKLIIPDKNIYVNAAWNIGVKNSKMPYIVILNDDLILPKLLMSNVKNFLGTTSDVGFIGLDTISKTKPELFIDYPKDTPLNFEFIDTRCECWGSAIFFKKENWVNIPEEMKVWCGDDFIFYKGIENGLKNYAICNSNVLHLHSLTSSLPGFDKIKKNDVRYYKKINPNFILGNTTEYHANFLQKIFSIKNLYKENIKKKVIYILGIKITIKIKSICQT